MSPPPGSRAAPGQHAKRGRGFFREIALCYTTARMPPPISPKPPGSRAPHDHGVDPKAAALPTSGPSFGSELTSSAVTIWGTPVSSNDSFLSPTMPPTNPLWAKSVDEVLTTLRAQTPAERAMTLLAAPDRLSSRVLGDTAFSPTRDDAGAAFDFDFSSLRGGPQEWQGETAWGMAVLAKRAYEPLDRVRPLLELQGFTVTALGTGDPPDGYLAVRGDLALLGFRGTIPTHGDDVRTDLRFMSTQGTHSGFLDKANQLWPQIERGLEQARAKLGPGQKLSVMATGHSLGAAVATLAAERVAKRPDLGAVEAVYTYGSPRVFQAPQAMAYNKLLGDRTYRYVNDTDVVTTLPPEAFYTHVGQRLFFDRNHLLRPGATDGQVIRDRIASPLVSVFAGAGGEAEFLPWAFDHSPQGYVKHLFVEANRPVDLATQNADLLDYWVKDRQPISVGMALAIMNDEQRAAAKARYGNDPVFASGLKYWASGEPPSPPKAPFRRGG